MKHSSIVYISGVAALSMALALAGAVSAQTTTSSNSAMMPVYATTSDGMVGNAIIPSGLPTLTGVFNGSVTSTDTATAVAPTTAVSVPVSASITVPAGAQPWIVASQAPMPEVVSIDASGNALVRGVALSGATSGSIAVQSWGGTWTVNTTAATQVTPGSGIAGDVSTIPAGDFVGVEGTLDPNQPWTIDATIVHDWTASPATAPAATVGTTVTGSVSGSGAVATGASTSASALPTGDTLYSGTASDVSGLSTGSSFALTDEAGNTYTVNVNPDATVWNSASTDIPLSSIVQGDNIRLDGTIQSDGTLTADVVRDTSQ